MYSIETPHGTYKGETLEAAQAAMRKGARIHEKAEKIKREKENRAYDMAQINACGVYERFIEKKALPRGWYVDCYPSEYIKPGSIADTREVTLYGKDRVFSGSDVRLVHNAVGEPILIYTAVCVYAVGYCEGETSTRGLASEVTSWILEQISQLASTR